ncbi:hypothetical protein HNO89_003337 [Sporosarcina luteola]|nr:hypothetical protein [Sporosarcina luteola]
MGIEVWLAILLGGFGLIFFAGIVTLFILEK